MKTLINNNQIKNNVNSKISRMCKELLKKNI